MNIVFDLDGTLIDSAPDIQAAASVVLAGLGCEPLGLEETKSFVGEGAAVLVSRMMAARGIDSTPALHAELLQAFLAQYESAVDKATYYPGVLDTLRALRAQGHRLGLCTNKPEQPTRAVMRHMRMAPLFDAFVAGGMLDSRKPAPQMLYKVIEDLGGGSALYVGDSEIDAETARRAEVPFALYTLGYRKTSVSDLHWNWQFAHFTELVAIVTEAENFISSG